MVSKLAATWTASRQLSRMASVPARRLAMALLVARKSRGQCRPRKLRTLKRKPTWQQTTRTLVFKRKPKP